MARREQNAQKLAWIVGASSGIGRALALELSRTGYRVAASARRSEELEELARRSEGAIRSFPLDIRNRQAVHETVASIEEAMGPIALAVFVAGTYVRDTPSRYDSETFHRLIDLNLVGTSHCLEAAIEVMVARGSGRIALVGSVSGYAGLPGGAFYGATKSALMTLAEGMYPELRQRGVDICVVNPGFVRTPLTDVNDFPMPFIISAEEAAKRIVSGLRAGRFEIAFTRRMVLLLKLLRLLPYPLFFAVTGRMLRKT